MAQEFVAKRLRLAEAAGKAPEAIPETSVKTTLQRVVQILKHHRNLFFASDIDHRPASILVTTLAAHAYRGDKDLQEAVLEAVELMPAFIERDGADWVVPNPVEPRENFADKWATTPACPARFFEWLRRLDADLREANQVRGLDKMAARLAEGFGTEPLEKAARRLGDTYRSEREHGRLGFAGTTGMLSGAGTLPVRPHDFFGSSAAR